MHWRDIVAYLQLWWFRITFPIGGILGVWGLAKMYEWIMERTADQRIKEFLQASVTDELRTQHGPVRYPLQRSISEISAGAGVAKWRLRGCLKRLKRRDVVVQDGDNWKLKM